MHTARICLYLIPYTEEKETEEEKRVYTYLGKFVVFVTSQSTYYLRLSIAVYLMLLEL